MAKVKPQISVFDGMDFPDYEFRQYPMMVYKGDPLKPENMVVEDDERWAEAKADGWVAKPLDLASPVIAGTTTPSSTKKVVT